MNAKLLLQFLFLASSFFHPFVLLLLLWASQEWTFPQGLLVEEEGAVQCWKCLPSIILESTHQQYSFLITSCPYRLLFRAHSSFIPTPAWLTEETSSLLPDGVLLSVVHLDSPSHLYLVTSGITLHPEAGKHALCLLAASTWVSVQVICLCSLHPSRYVVFVP